VLLAHELKAGFGIDSAFVILNSSQQCSLPYAAIYCPPTGLLESCLELTRGRSGAMLVHVSGYGYSRDGAPALLADALETARASGQFRAAAYFHETLATGWPWTSAFWHTGRQKSALRRIVAQGELIVTSLERQGEWLDPESRKLGGPPIELLPVFSPAGETDAPVPFLQREEVMLVFGLAATRQWSYQQLAAAGNLVNRLGIQEILDVGPECNHPPDVNGIRVKRIGLLPAEDLPGAFSQARFGFVPHPWFCLAKSSVFAAYCAQGTIPVLAKPFPAEADGLREGVHVVTPRTADAVRGAGWEACSRAAWSWYMTHRLRVHAERYAKWMGDGR